MALPDSVPLVRSKAVAFTDLDGEIVMLDTEGGHYYELDAVGSRIWALLEDEPCMAKLREALTAEYDIDGETCGRDLAEFLGELEELGLVAAGAAETAGR